MITDNIIIALHPEHNISEVIYLTKLQDGKPLPPPHKDRTNQEWLDLLNIANSEWDFSGVSTIGFASKEPLFSFVM